MQARRLPAYQGVAWVIAAYRLFRANPSLLSILTFVYLMVFTLMLVLPGGVGGVLFPVLQPLLVLAIANGCRSIANRNRSTVAKPLPELLEGIRSHRNRLLKLGSLQLAGSMLVMLVMLAFDLKPDPQQPDQLLQILALVAVLSSPLLLAFWFAPLLTGWHDLAPLKSAFFSLVACLRNWRAFAVYALCLFAIAVIPALLAMFALQVSDTFGQIMTKLVEILMLVLILPMFLAGNFVSYQDIFTVPDDA